MDAYSELLALTDSGVIQEGTDLPKVQLHKWLVLGQTEYVCKYGTLSDGHEKLTAAQRYSQALKEWYYLALNVRSQRSLAKRAQADLLEALDRKDGAIKVTDKLRAEADVEDAETRLLTALSTVQDQMRMIKVYAEEAAKLREQVETRYPGGIEEAEPDNWEAVARYRLTKEQTQGMARERLDNVPLPPEKKAEIGYEAHRVDAIAPLLIADQDKCKEIAQAYEQKLVASGLKLVEGDK